MKKLSFKVVDENRKEDLIQIKVSHNVFDRPKWFNFNYRQVSSGRWKSHVAKKIREVKNARSQKLSKDLTGDYEE